MFGVAALAAAGLAAFDAVDSNEPATPPRGGQPRIELQLPQVAEAQQPEAAEILGGCLNDTECYGEPSHLPAGWDLSAGAPVD